MHFRAMRHPLQPSVTFLAWSWRSVGLCVNITALKWSLSSLAYSPCVSLGKVNLPSFRFFTVYEVRRTTVTTPGDVCVTSIR